MLDAILIFFIVSLISFIGSVQLGPVNLLVIQTTLQQNFRAGLWVALGGCLPEIIYATLALQGHVLLQKSQSIIHYLEIIVIPVFLGIGLKNLIWNGQGIQNHTTHDISKNYEANLKNMASGFSFGILNPQLLPFWFFILIYLDKQFKINDLASKISFVFGTAFGAFGILILFVFLTNRFRNQVYLFFQKYSFQKIFGYIFIGLAILQAFNLYF